MADFILSYTGQEIDEKLGKIDELSQGVGEITSNINTINTTLELKADKSDIAQPNWNQNDETASDYIKNRPFYETEERKYQLPETTIEVSDEFGISLNCTTPFEEGQNYTIIFNDVTYECVVREWYDSFDDKTYLIMGNGTLGWVDDGLGNGEPFMCRYRLGNSFALVTSELGTFTISIFRMEKVIHRIDLKYMSESLPGLKVEGTNFEVDGEVYTASSGSEIFNDYEGNKATGSCSHAEGANTTASGSCSHAEGCVTKASGDYSHAEGYRTVASGASSHAECWYTTASGEYSHAEGWYTIASGEGSHAEGHDNEASGDCSHAEGFENKASGNYSHAEGESTVASGASSHAEGRDTVASGDFSHAEGFGTEALLNQHAQGHYNDTTTATAGAVKGTGTGTAFVIGNGTSIYSTSNAFRIDYNGKPYAKSALTTTGCDYAEYFEWADGNVELEDRRGYFVTLDGANIKIATPGDYILGIISGQPSVIGNGDEDWLGRYIMDEFGAFIYEEFEYEEVVGHDKETGEEITVTKTGMKYKENPDYDPSKGYIQREDRPEWDAVGMLGVLSVRDDGTCKVNGYCQVAEGGTATASDTGYRVISRVNDSIVKIIFK